MVKGGIEREFGGVRKEKGDEEGIGVLGEKVGELLVGGGLGEKGVMGMEGGLGRGWKVVWVDGEGRVVDKEGI